MSGDGSVSVPEKKPNQNKRWQVFKKRWEDRCEEVKGFRPEVTLSADKPTFHRIDKKYSRAEMEEIISYFLNSKKADKHLSITACFSADTINAWKQQAKI